MSSQEVVNVTALDQGVLKENSDILRVSGFSSSEILVRGLEIG